MYIFGENFLYFCDFIQHIHEINEIDERYNQAVQEFLQLRQDLHIEFKLPNYPHNKMLKRQAYKQYMDRFKRIYELIQASKKPNTQTTKYWANGLFRLHLFQYTASKLYFIRNVFYMHLYLIAKVLYLLLSKNVDAEVNVGVNANMNANVNVNARNNLQVEDTQAIYPQMIYPQAIPVQHTPQHMPIQQLPLQQHLPQMDYVQYSNIILTNMRLIHTINHLFEQANIQFRQADTCYSPNYNRNHQMVIIEQLWEYMENIGLAMHDLIIQIYNVIELQNEKIGFHNVMLSMSIPELAFFPEPWNTPHNSFRKFMARIDQYLDLIQISSLYKLKLSQDHDDDEVGEEQQTSDDETSVQNTSLSYQLFDTYCYEDESSL